MAEQNFARLLMGPFGLIALAAALTASACGDDDDGDSGGAGGAGAPATSGAAGAPRGEPQPALGALCGGSNPACPEGLECVLQQCTVASCLSNGPGAEHGCPGNGFCYGFDSGAGNYCARICEVDADCKAVHPDLYCRALSSADPYRLKLCTTEFG
jgi:hypothetical protein